MKFYQLSVEHEGTKTCKVSSDKLVWKQTRSTGLWVPTPLLTCQETEPSLSNNQKVIAAANQSLFS